jgi:hypothetical protein
MEIRGLYFHPGPWSVLSSWLTVWLVSSLHPWACIKPNAEPNIKPHLPISFFLQPNQKISSFCSSMLSMFSIWKPQNFNFKNNFSPSKFLTPEQQLEISSWEFPGNLTIITNFGSYPNSFLLQPHNFSNWYGD